MRGLQNGAFGQPMPLEVRVFSTMNAPATFATYLLAGLLYAFAAIVEGGRSRKLALAAAPIGLLALALTTSRSLWLGLIFGVLYLSAALPSRLRVRVVAAVVLTLVAAGFATQIPGIQRVVDARLKSFTSGTSDISAGARITGHTEALAKLATEPLGEGMGSTDTDHATDGSDTASARTTPPCWSFSTLSAGLERSSTPPAWPSPSRKSSCSAEAPPPQPPLPGRSSLRFSRNRCSHPSWLEFPVSLHGAALAWP